MAIHRFKCSDDLNKEIILFSQFHKFDSKDNLVEQFDSWIKEEKIEKLIIKEEKFLQTNQYDGDITIKLFKSIKYYYIKKILNCEKEKGKEKGKKKKSPTYFEFSFIEKIHKDIIENFETNRSFKPADTYILFLQKNEIEGNKFIKKCYKNNYYQIKNKKYYVNE